MKYLKFAIKNYKGISEVEISFLRDHKSRSKIFTLVGLNESGKTTILESLNYFYNYLLKGNGKNEGDLIPRHQGHNFNGEISFSAQILLENHEVDLIKAETKKNFDMEYQGKFLTLDLALKLDYETSNFTGFRIPYTISNIKFKSKTNNRERPFNKLPKADELIEKLIVNHLPEIVYYEDFIFDFPSIINLEAYPNEKYKQKICRDMLQDVLNSVDKNLTLKKHIVNRLKPETLAKILKKTLDDLTPSILKQNKKNAEQTVGKIESAINNRIIESLGTIFKFKNKSDKRIEVTLIEPSANNNNQIQIKFEFMDNEESFEISERSMGFRWFLSFLLLTVFRRYRDEHSRGMFFLLDEPASNLHQSAQSEILKLLNDMVKDKQVYVCYSTHSLHLINPLWIDDAFVIFNKSLDYSTTMKENFDKKPTEISLERYRKFANENPQKSYYFQPILDHLAYRPSNLELTKNSILVEGKNDFFIYNYFLNFFSKKYKFNFVPLMGGSDSAEPIIQLCLGWGKDFLVLLDSDDRTGLKVSGGEGSKKRYIKKYGWLLENKLFTLHDVAPDWEGYKLESLISKEDKEKLGKQKNKINLKIQELTKTKEKLVFTKQTEDNFELLFAFLHEQLSKIAT